MKDRTKKFNDGVRAILLLPAILCEVYAEAYVAVIRAVFKAAGLYNKKAN